MKELIKGFAGSTRPTYTQGVTISPSGRVVGAGGGSGSEGK